MANIQTSRVKPGTEPYRSDSCCRYVGEWVHFGPFDMEAKHKTRGGQITGGIDIWRLIIILIIIAIPTVLIFRPVVKKAGFSRWWSLVLIVPLINLIMVWVFAFMEWPAEKSA